MAEQVDPLFAQLRDTPELAERLGWIETLCGQFEPYADRNFRSELQVQFISRFWEMYLGCAFLNGGFELLPRKGRSAEGPDICVLQDGSRIWIEAAAPSRGAGADSVPEPESQNGLVSEDKIVLRFCSEICYKFSRYQNYLDKGVVKQDEPFLIALNGARIPEARAGFPDDLPYPIQAVLPFGPFTVQINTKTREKTAEGFAYRTRIVKRSKAEVPTDLFLDPKYAAISGLLFSNVSAFDSREVSLKAVSLLHNPSRTNGLPTGWLRAGLEWWVENNSLQIRGW